MKPAMLTVPRRGDRKRGILPYMYRSLGVVSDKIAQLSAPPV